MKPLAKASDTRRRHAEHPEAIDRFVSPVGVPCETVKHLANPPCFIVLERPSIPVPLDERGARLSRENRRASSYLTPIRPLEPPPEQPGAKEPQKPTRTLDRPFHSGVQPIGRRRTADLRDARVGRCGPPQSGDCGGHAGIRPGAWLASRRAMMTRIGLSRRLFPDFGERLG
jgi:hypothetical protein